MRIPERMSFGMLDSSDVTDEGGEPTVMPSEAMTSETGPSILDQGPVMTLAPATPFLPSQAATGLTPAPAAVARPAAAPVAPVAQPAAGWGSVFTNLFKATGQASTAYAASIKARSVAKKPLIPIPPKGLAPVSTGLSMTTWILIGGGAVAVLAITYLLVRK